MRFSSTTPSASPGKLPPPTSRSPSTSPLGCRTSSRPIARSSTKRPRRWTEPDSSYRRISPAQNASPHSERQNARDDGPKNEPRPAPRIRRSRPPNEPTAPDPRAGGPRARPPLQPKPSRTQAAKGKKRYGEQEPRPVRPKKILKQRTARDRRS